MYFVWYLLLGLASGWIANLIVKGDGSGLIINLIVGLVGGVLGGWLFSPVGPAPAIRIRPHRPSENAAYARPAYAGPIGIFII